MTKIVSFFRSKKGKKLGAVFLLVVIVFSSFSISSSAASYQTIAPIEFNDYSEPYPDYPTSAVAFPGGHTEMLYHGGTTYRTYLNNDDYLAYDDHIGTLLKDDQYLPTIKIHLSTPYASVYVNGTVYNGSTDVSSPSSSILYNTTSFVSYPVQNSLSDAFDTSYYYYQWTIVLGVYYDYDVVYQKGFNDGVCSESAQEYWFDVIYELAYTDGYLAGVGDFTGDADVFGDNILGRTLSAPMRALNSFVLYESASGFQVTLGGVLGTCICVSLFLAFIKIFA